MAFKIYTKTGDSGQTGLFGGERVPKDHLRIEAYGTIDELNSHIGLLQAFLQLDGVTTSAGMPESGNLLAQVEFLKQIQAELFTIGSQLATPFGKTPPVSPVSSVQAAQLEHAIDGLEEGLAPLSSFILPAGSRATCQAHICRTVTRRAERCIVRLDHLEAVDPEIVIYTNRLSDYFFTLSRAIAAAGGEGDTAWTARA